MRKACMISAVWLFISISMAAHEFWIQPAHARVNVGDRVSLQVMVGEKFSGETWKGKGSRVSTFNHYRGENVEDLLLSIEPGNAIVDIPDFIPRQEGTHLIALTTNKVFIEMDPGKFDDYLKEDGLLKAYEYRIAHNEKFKNGRERYSRCAKLLLQAGKVTDYTYRKKAGHELEIVPLSNPYDVMPEKGLIFKVYYEGYPLPDALVKWWRKDHDSVEMDSDITDRQGEVRFDTQKPGLYMISVVHMIRLHNDAEADWQSTWASLVFGI